MIYQHRQTGTAILVIMLIAAIMLLVVSGGSLWPALILLGVVSLLFSSMTVRVDEQHVSWHFTLGFWKKSLPLGEVIAARVIKTRWYYGLGIRLIPTGWLYTVSGLTAVELTLSSGSVIALGSDDANNLLQAIQRNITSVGT